MSFQFIKGETMKSLQVMSAAVLFAASLFALRVASAQQVGTHRAELQRHDLSAPGREVIQVRVALDPGTVAPRHRHPGEEIIYVLEGTWEYRLEGKPPVTLEAGDVLFIPAGAVHSARNVGRVKGSELATYIVEKGKPLVEVIE
jgi:quercetin dioxygenase-like cupin family protein